MKKSFCLLLTMVMLFALAVPAFAATPEIIVPHYTNASTVRASLEIDNDGLAKVNVYCMGNTGTSSISVVYYLEKQVGSSWSRVDIGTTGNQWSHSVSSRILSQTKTVQLNSSGTYRVTATFEVKISSTETITVTDTDTF